MVVYTHTRLDSNEIFYVGIGKTEKRANSKHGRNKHWKNIVEKVGYSILIVHTCDTWDEACYTEKYLIGYYGRYDLGLGELVNMTEGGDGTVGRVVSIETKAKMSDAHKIMSDESRAKISASLRGVKRSEEAKANMKGVKRSEEAKVNMSAARKNSMLVKEHLAKINAAKIGVKRSEEVITMLKTRIFSEETRAKMSASQKGKKLSDEHRIKISNSLNGKIISKETIAKRVATRKANALLKK